MQLKFLSLVIVLFSVQFVFAQRTITGTVTDSESNEPLIGANVLVSGSTTGTVTDIDGSFTLEVPDNVEALNVSYTGYISQTVSIAGGVTTVNIQLKIGSVLDEVVVIGYGTQRKGDITGAVSSVSSEEINNTSYASTGALLQGKVAGVRVETNSGAPGASVNIVIRGTGTFGNDQPLYVVDGNIVGSMDFLNPNDIESVEVLKRCSCSRNLWKPCC